MTPIRIGEINSYSFTALREFTQSYRHGIELAVDEVNARGGAAGRPLEMVFRDDARDRQEAARQATDLLVNEKVDLLAGTFASDMALTVAGIASAHRKVFLAGEPRADALVWSEGSRYVFRLRTSQYMMASALVDQVLKRRERRWATISPAYPGQGTRMVDVFRRVLSERMPDVEWVGASFFPLGRIDAPAAVAELSAMNPEAVFAVVYGDDLAAFIREGHERGYFKNRLTVSPFAGDPEYIGSLTLDTGDEWITLGYPEDDERPGLVAFRRAYQSRFGEAPTLGSLIGYLLIQMAAAGLDRAGSADTEALIKALRGLSFEPAIGPLTIRAGDHQSTMGAWVGKLAYADGRNRLGGWTFVDGSSLLPAEAEGAAMRPPGAND